MLVLVTALAPGFLKHFLPGCCGEKVTRPDTCLCQGRNQPDCCCDPCWEATLLAQSRMSRREQAELHCRELVLGRMSSHPFAPQYDMHPTHEHLSHPLGHL